MPDPDAACGALPAHVEHAVLKTIDEAVRKHRSVRSVTHESPHRGLRDTFSPPACKKCLCFVTFRIARSVFHRCRQAVHALRSAAFNDEAMYHLQASAPSLLRRAGHGQSAAS